MIAETTKFLRRLSSPLRRNFWLAKPSRAVDAPGVLLISFPQASSLEKRRLLNGYSHYRRQALTAGDRPLDALLSDSPSLFSRALLFLTRTVSFWPKLLDGTLPWSIHLCEVENLARVHQQLQAGVPVVHLNDLRSCRYRDLRRLERTLRHLEHRHYECWVVFRDRCEAFVPASLAFPEEPLAIVELEELARARTEPDQRSPQLSQVAAEPGTLRIMSYNVHSCIGLDGRLSVRRVAEVLERYSPHFVALQELDRGCQRTAHADQLEELSRLWPSTPMFAPSMPKNGGEYGIGCLSRLPVSDWRWETLSQGRTGEPRVAQVVTTQWQNKPLTVVNTHLGLTRAGRLGQLRKLEEILGQTPGNLILAGDLNCAPGGPEHKLLGGLLQETQSIPKRTWFGSYPLRVLDYTLFRGELEVSRSLAPRDALTRLASDHLPLITDFTES